MMYFLLLLIVADQLAESVLAKQYNLKSKENNIILFSAVSAFFALIFFVINSGGELEFNLDILPYSALFAFFFGTAVVTQVFAIKTGSLSMTVLFSSYSLLIPTVYGMFFLKEDVGAMFYMGLVLLLISLFLININKNENLKFSPVWIVCILLCFISNGLCSTVQKVQQLNFSGAYKNEFMIIALTIVSAVLFTLGIIKHGNRKEMLKSCIGYGSIKGLGNGFMNYIVMVVSAYLPSAVLFPSISAGSIFMNYVCSLLIYKEKLTKRQTVGYIIGIFSVILLNI